MRTEGEPVIVNKAILSVSFYLKPPSGWWVTLSGYNDPGCMRDREESVLVVAEGRRREEKTLDCGAHSQAI